MKWMLYFLPNLLGSASKVDVYAYRFENVGSKSASDVIYFHSTIGLQPTSQLKPLKKQNVEPVKVLEKIHDLIDLSGGQQLKAVELIKDYIRDFKIQESKAESFKIFVPFLYQGYFDKSEYDVDLLSHDVLDYLELVLAGMELTKKKKKSVIVDGEVDWDKLTFNGLLTALPRIYFNPKQRYKKNIHYGACLAKGEENYMVGKETSDTCLFVCHTKEVDYLLEHLVDRQIQAFNELKIEDDWVCVLNRDRVSKKVISGLKDPLSLEVDPFRKGHLQTKPLIDEEEEDGSKKKKEPKPVVLTEVLNPPLLFHRVLVRLVDLEEKAAEIMEGKDSAYIRKDISNLILDSNFKLLKDLNNYLEIELKEFKTKIKLNFGFELPNKFLFNKITKEQPKVELLIKKRDTDSPLFNEFYILVTLNNGDWLIAQNPFRNYFITLK